MSKISKIFIIGVAGLSVILIIVWGLLKNQTQQQPQQQPQQQSQQQPASEEAIEAEAIGKEFDTYKIESREDYEGLKKIVVDVRTTPNDFGGFSSGKATFFFKDGVLQPVPDSFLKTLVESEKIDQNDKIIDLKFYSNFDKFGPESIYKDVFVATVELANLNTEESSFGILGKYLFLFFDKYGNLLFKSLGESPISN